MRLSFKLRLIAFVVFINLFVMKIAFAQDTGLNADTLAPALELLIKFLNDVTFLPFSVGFVLVATGLAKRLTFLSAIPAGAIALTFQVLVWALWVLAQHFGYADQFAGWIGAATTILGAVAGIAASSYLSTKLHESAARNDVPVIGYTRPALMADKAK